MNDILAWLGLDIQILWAHIVNIIILILAFKYLLWDITVKEIAERRALIKKLESADEAYDDIIKKAKNEADNLRQDGKTKRDELISQAQWIGEKRKEEIINSGHQKAESILSDAKAKAKVLEDEMNNGFEDAVKSVSTATIKKIFWDKKDIEDEYITNIIKEVKNN